MLYHYVASDAVGKLYESDIDAQNLDGVLKTLAANGLRPINIQSLKDSKGIIIFKGSVNLTDKIFLTKYLSLMLKVGTDLLSAINILIADFEKPIMRTLLIEVRENLMRGQAFNQVFSRYPKYFSPVFVNMVKAAEASGNLQKTFEDLSLSLQRDGELKSRIRAALIYPIIILVASVTVFVFLSTFAVPKISAVFKDSGIQVPGFSKIVFAVGDFINANVVSLGIGFAVFAIAFWIFFFKTKPGKQMFDNFLSSLPVVKNLYRDIAIQRFASTFSSLMKAGLPIIQATHITADVVVNKRFKDALYRIADDGLAKGITIGDAFRREAIFPRVVTNLIAISEKAGHLEELLDTLADFYTSRIDASVKVLISVLEPILLLGMGGMVGLIAVSIIIPIYQLTSVF